MLAFVAYAISHLSGSGFQGKSNHLQHMFPDWVSTGAGETEAKGFPRGAETLLLADWLVGWGVWLIGLLLSPRLSRPFQISWEF